MSMFATQTFSSEGISRLFIHSPSTGGSTLDSTHKVSASRQFRLVFVQQIQVLFIPETYQLTRRSYSSSDDAPLEIQQAIF